MLAPVAGEMSAELTERTPEIVELWLAGGLPLGLGTAGFAADITSAALWLASSEFEFCDQPGFGGDRGDVRSLVANAHFL